MPINRIFEGGYHELINWLERAIEEKREELVSGRVDSLEKLSKINTEIRAYRTILEKCEELSKG